MSILDNLKRHKLVCEELNQLYARKNSDYGDSFHETYVSEGMAMARIRLMDKLNRFCTLTRNQNQNVKDESVRDTLIDLANYSIMTVMELDAEKDERKVDFQKDENPKPRPDITKWNLTFRGAPMPEINNRYEMVAWIKQLCNDLDIHFDRDGRLL